MVMSTKTAGSCSKAHTIIESQKVFILDIEALRSWYRYSWLKCQESYLELYVPALLGNTRYHPLASRQPDSSQSRLQQRHGPSQNKHSPILPAME